MPEENSFQEWEDTIKPWDQEPIQQPQPVQEQINIEVQQPVQQPVQEEMAQIERDQVQVNSQEIPVSQREPNYHPSWLTKIVTGILRFLWIVLIWSGILNFTVSPSEVFPFWKILLFAGLETLLGLWYFYLWNLLYKTKARINRWISFWYVSGLILLTYFFMNVFNKRKVGDYEVILALMYFAVGVLVYILFVAIIWIIKCRKLKKKWIISWKILDINPERKIIWVVTTILLFLVVIVDFMYWKFRYSKIPGIDETTLNHKEHNIPLSAEEDAIIQLKALELARDTDVWKNVENFYPFFRQYYNEFKLWWEWNQDECEVISSWNQSYCWTRAWNEKTINRYMNHHFYKIKESWRENTTKEYLMIDDKKVTEKEYIEINEEEIRERINQLKKIAALDYYLPNDRFMFYAKDEIVPMIFTQYFQSFSRDSVTLLQYYAQKKDRDMVFWIVELNYKIADIVENIWGFLWIMLSHAMHEVIDRAVNSSIWLYPQSLRKQLSELCFEYLWEKDEVLRKGAVWEHVIRNESKDILLDELQDKPSPIQFLYHSPFNSKSDTNRLMVFMDNCLSYWPDEQKEKCVVGWVDLDELVYEKLRYSVYNLYGRYSYSILHPRLQWLNYTIDKNIYHKTSLIDNLRAWKYVSRYDEVDWNHDKELYDQNLLVPPEE